MSLLICQHAFLWRPCPGYNLQSSHHDNGQRNYQGGVIQACEVPLVHDAQAALAERDQHTVHCLTSVHGDLFVPRLAVVRAALERHVDSLRLRVRIAEVDQV